MDIRDKVVIITGASARLSRAAADKLGRIDMLVNNAGQGMAGLAESADIAAYRSILELNVFGPVLAAENRI